MSKSTQERVREMSIRGCSQRGIAQALGISRNTVSKYLSADLSPAPPVRPAGSSPLLEPHEAEVSSWLEADESLPRRQRHTARRVYDRLVAERGFEGSLSTVERFVRGWREGRAAAASEGFLELGRPAGTAQGDYGNALAVLGGAEAAARALAVALPHPDARFVCCPVSQRSECLCEALMQIFEHVGGVPPVPVPGSATEAGRRLGGVVRESSLLAAFRQHCGFEVRFRDPRSGWEKGSVENAVGFLRRNLMVPPPQAPDLGALNERLLAACDALPGLPHYRTGEPVRAAFGEDRAALLPLPGARFDAVRRGRRRADREGRVEVDGAPCCAGPHRRGRRVLVGLRASSVEVLDEPGRPAARLPRSWGGAGETVFDPASPMPAVTARPRSRGRSRPRASVPEAMRDGTGRCGKEERRQVLRAVQRAAEACGFDAAARAAARIFEGGRVPDRAGVDVLARAIRDGSADGGAADLSVYDGLSGGGGHVA